MTARSTVRSTINDAILLCNRESWENAATLLQSVSGATKIEAYKIFVLMGCVHWKVGGWNKNLAVSIWEDVIKNGKEVADHVTLASAYYWLSIYYGEKDNNEKSLEYVKLAQTIYPEISDESIFVEIEEKEI